MKSDAFFALCRLAFFLAWFALVWIYVPWFFITIVIVGIALVIYDLNK